MRHPLALVPLLIAASCGPPPPQPTAIQRGAALFAPVSDALGASIAADLKKSSPSGFEAYLKEIGGKTEADLARKISKEVLVRYAEALSVSSSKEAELRAGTFDEAANARSAKELLALDITTKEGFTQVGVTVSEKLRRSEWTGGLEREFAVRVLRDERARKPEKN